MGALEGGQVERAKVCHPQAGDGLGDGLADVLQPPAVAFHAELHQSDAV